MVKEKDNLYVCEECGFIYESNEWAEKCEVWCKEHHSCNIEITKHSKGGKNEKS